jgi:hypothetical protein
VLIAGFLKLILKVLNTNIIFWHWNHLWP